MVCKRCGEYEPGKIGGVCVRVRWGRDAFRQKYCMNQRARESTQDCKLAQEAPGRVRKVCERHCVDEEELGWVCERHDACMGMCVRGTVQVREGLWRLSNQHGANARVWG